MQDFEARLQEAIEGSGLTQARVAELVGVHPNLVTSWVSGKTCPRLPNLARLVAALGVDASWLLLGDDSKAATDDPVAAEVRRLSGDLLELVKLARDSS